MPKTSVCGKLKISTNC